MDWVYLSPHLDDAAFSCGGLIRHQAQRDQRVAVWTICAGDPPPGPLSLFAQSLHERWSAVGNPVARRRVEDITSCRKMGAAWHHFSIPDCIYRRSPEEGSPLYASEEELFGQIHPDEGGLIDDLTGHLIQSLPSGANIVCPLTIGGHVDHRLSRAAVERLGIGLWYYADYPYVQMEGGDLAQETSAILNVDLEAKTEGMQVERFHLSKADLEVWKEAAAAHASQIGNFWTGLGAMQDAIQSYCRQMGGLYLWRKI